MDAKLNDMPVWRNWQTRTTQNRVPSGVPVRPRPPVSFSFYTGYPVFIFVKSSTNFNNFRCGCSLMVKPQPSKLMSWVRFPSPAPYIISSTQCFVSRKRSIAFFICLDPDKALPLQPGKLAAHSSRFIKKSKFSPSFGQLCCPFLFDSLL